MNTTMNTTTTADPLSEVWGARLTAYLSATGMVVMYYDILLTLKDEARLVWPGGLTLPKFLYYLNRYLSCVTVIICNYEVAALRPAIPDSFCKAWVMSGGAIPITTFSATALLTLRVTALYRRSRWFAPAIWVAFAIFQGLRTAVMIYGAVNLVGNLRYSPISNVCIPINNSYRSAASMLVPGIYDFLLLALTLVKGVKSAISLRTGTGSNIMLTMIRDELLFFFTISLLRIFNSIAWLLLSPSLMGVGIYAEWGLESTLTSRFFLNLRSIALYQPETAFEVRANSASAISAFHTRRTWEKQGPLRTDLFVGSDTNSIISIHANVAQSKEGNMNRTETFDLEEMEPQTQQRSRRDELGSMKDVKC